MPDNDNAGLPNDSLRARPVKARPARQERAAQSRIRIADAAVEVLASHGLAGLTHRRVAERANVPLAATTYYYETKFDIVADASNRLLDDYVQAFRRVAARHAAAENTVPDFRDFGVQLLANAAGRHRAGTLAWCEIMLDAAQHSDTRALARSWYAELAEAWLEIATVLGVGDARAVVQPAIETVSGLLFMTVALALSEAQIDAVFQQGADPVEAWRPVDEGKAKPLIERAGRKARDTRERILAAAIELLIVEGPAGVTYRAVAARAGLTTAAPAYHFQSIDTLLSVAQARLFEKSKDRYREVMARVDYGGLDVERLVDLTATVFLREATQFGELSLASYAIWIEAARKIELRSMIWSAIEDQCLAWRRLLDKLMADQRPLDALLAQALFLGKLIRILSTGATTSDLALVRSEFGRDLKAIVASRFWI